MRNDNFYIITEKGFYKDYILETFADTKEEAHCFKRFEDAQVVLNALGNYQGIKGEILQDPYADNLTDLMNMAAKFLKQADEQAAINPPTEEILVVIVEPMKKPYKKIIPNTLEAFNDIVGGYIEIVNIDRTKSGSSVAITLNEEGKLIGLPFNRRIVDFDVLVGTFFITAYNLQGDNVSLTEEEANRYIRRFAPIEVYIK